MIKKKFRVPKELIPLILKKGDTDTSELFIIKSLKNNENFYRYRVIISRKIHLKAVKRNHLRRQIYEIIRLNSDEKPMESKDIILIPKKHSINKDYSDLEKDLKNKIINK